MTEPIAVFVWRLMVLFLLAHAIPNERGSVKIAIIVTVGAIAAMVACRKRL